jgi:hypothetical protein
MWTTARRATRSDFPTTVVAVGVLTALLGAQTANGPAERCVPSDGVIRQMLRERVDAQGKGVGIVVGVIEPEGARSFRTVSSMTATRARSTVTPSSRSAR